MVAVAPGIVETPPMKQISEPVKQSIIAALAIQCFATPEEVADLACFLASDAAGYITGSVHVIDGAIFPGSCSRYSAAYS